MDILFLLKKKLIRHCEKGLFEVDFLFVVDFLQFCRNQIYTVYV